MNAAEDAAKKAAAEYGITPEEVLRRAAVADQLDTLKTMSAPAKLRHASLVRLKQLIELYPEEAKRMLGQLGHADASDHDPGP